MTDTAEEVKTSLSQLLIDARNSKNMSIDEAAEKLNLSSTQLANLEQDSLDLKSLSTFERGYLRNYAFLLNVDINEFEQQFPSDKDVGAELQSIHRENYATQKPFISKGWRRFIYFIVFLVFVVWLLSFLEIDLTQTDFNRALQEATEMTLPNPEQ